MDEYQAVFLDAQGTILQAHPSTIDIYAHACRECDRSFRRDEIAKAIGELWEEHKHATDGQKRYDTSDAVTKQWWFDFNARLFRRLGLSEGLERFVEILWDLFGRPENWRPYPEVNEVLAELRLRGYRLGVVSNWDSRLLPICDGIGISHQVDFVLASAMVGVEKPDPRIFQVALDRAGVSSDRAIHVGDDYEADIQGAGGAGIRAVHLVRDGGGRANGSSIRTLTELLQILP